MRHEQRRCAYCGIGYSYQQSGHGCHNPNNSEKWCPECAVIAGEALKAAFKDVPRKFKNIWVDTDDVTVEELVEHRNKCIEKKKEEGKLWCERVSMNLYDIKDIDRRNRTFYIRYNKMHYHVSYWTKPPRKEEITVEMELNVETGELTPWREIPLHPMANLFSGLYQDD